MSLAVGQAYKKAIMGEMTRILDRLVRPARTTTWQMVLLLLSFYVLVALVAELLTDDPDLKLLLRGLDNWICIVFLGDFFFRLYRAPAKLQFLKWNWIDLVSSIPAWDALRVGRLIRVLRVLRALRSAKYIATHVFKNKWSGLAAAATLSFVFVSFAAIAILSTENSPDANIKSASDALWWAMTTITTVGYGDRYPVTPEGRIVASLLMVAGAGMFGLFSGAVASAFVQSDSQETQSEMALMRGELVRLQDQIQFLQKKLEEEDEVGRLVEEIRELRRTLEGGGSRAAAAVDAVDPIER